MLDMAGDFPVQEARRAEKKSRPVDPRAKKVLTSRDISGSGIKGTLAKTRA